MSAVRSLTKKLAIRNAYVREALAEFLGTFVLVVIGDASVAQMTLSRQKSGHFLGVSFAFGLAVMIGIFVSIGVSGGHINPAVTLAMATVGKLPWPKVPVYMLAQYLGAFVASVVLFYVYADALIHYEGERKSMATAGIWATYPQDFLSTGNAFADQVLGTALLLVGILAITDSRNTNTPKGVIPLMIGLLVVAIGLSYGFNCGGAINPARDLSPRLFTLIAGWGTRVFAVHCNLWWWIPVVAPYVGGVIGAWIYFLLVEIHWPVEADEELKGEITGSQQLSTEYRQVTEKRRGMMNEFQASSYQPRCCCCYGTNHHRKMPHNLRHVMTDHHSFREVC